MLWKEDAVDFKFEWLVPELVCKVVLPEEMIGEGLEEYDQLLTEVLNQMHDKIHLIVDVTKLKNMASLTEAHKLKHPRHRNMGRLLLLGLHTNVIARFMTSLIAQAAGISYKAFDTQEEVFAYLHQMEGIKVT